MAGPMGDSGMSSPAEGISRYPGVRPFGDDEIQRRLFRGREEETYELEQLVLAERLVLIFARSGIGKSSLINAGLLAPLREKGYFPMVVRVSGTTGTPLDCLYDGIRAAADRAAERGLIEYEPPEPQWNKTSLWHFFKTFELWRGDNLLSPVLIIDQFEELFTLHGVEQRKQLIHQLADLIRGTRPRGGLADQGPKLSDTPPDVRVVLSLREDFYANLEELRDRIPLIYKTPFRLKPLTREQAKRAIVEPAALDDDRFSTPAFAWSDEALGEVLDFLSEQQLGEGKTTIGKEVEPFQLQLICQHAEQTVRAGKLKTLTRDALGGAEDLKRILSGFYEESLRRICNRFPREKGLRERLERLCEYGLITARGRRLLREESTIKQDDGVGADILREMVELRLLRKEPRVGDNYYELTHDTLIEPIQLSRQAREERKAREAKEARWLEQRKLRKRVIAAGVAATLALTVIGAWALWERAQTQRVFQAKQQALADKREAEVARQRAEEDKQRALAVTQQALEEKRESVKFAVNARLEAGEKQARLRVAEAETKLAEIQPRVDAAQKRLAEAKVQAAELRAQTAQAQDQEYQEQAKRHVAEAEAALAEAKGEFETARKAVFEAKKRVTQQQAQAIEVEPILAESQRQSEILVAQLDGTGTMPPETQRSVEPVESPLTEEKAELRTQAALDLAALEFRETEPEITYATLVEQYREFLRSSGSELSAEEAREIENKIRELERTAERFAELKRKDNDPNFSVCESFDQWTAFQPQRTLGPEAHHRDLRLAELRALLENSAAVTTQENFITSRGRSDLVLNETFTQRKDRVYIHIWVNSPRRELVKLTVKQGNTEVPVWNAKRVAQVPLRGVRMGYHLWTWRGANRAGRHEFRLYNAENRLICRRGFEIVAANP